MRESVIYQEIVQQSELRLIMRQLNRRIGVVNSTLQTKIQNLAIAQLEELAEALLDFGSEADLVDWVNKREI